MCLSVGLFEFIVPKVIELLACLYSCLSSNLGRKSSATISSDTLSLPFCYSSPSENSTMCVLVHFWCPTGPLGSVCFSLLFFFFRPCNSVVYIVLSSCSWFLLLLLKSAFNLFSEFFILVTVLLSSRIFFGFFLVFLNCLGIFPFHSHIIILTFSTSPFNSLSIFKNVILKFLSSKSAFRAFSGQCLLIYFF